MRFSKQAPLGWLDEFNSWMSFVGDPMGQWSMFYDLGPPKEALQNFTNLQFSFVCLDTDDGLAALRIAQQTLRLVNIDLKEGEATSVSEECGQCQNSERPAIADIISTLIVETPEREDTLRELKAELGTLPCSNREALVRHQEALGDYYFTLESTRDALQQVAEALSGNPSERRPISYSVWRLKQLMRSVDLKRLTGEEETAYRDELSRALACLAFYQNRVVGQPGLETHPSIGETNGKESGRHLQTEISRMISDAQGASQESLDRLIGSLIPLGGKRLGLGA